MARLLVSMVVALGLYAGAMPAQAADLDGYEVVHIKNGPNELTMQGHDVLAFRAWRENYNAHGFDIVTLYSRDKAEGEPEVWNLVSFFKQDEGEERELNELTLSGGADCRLTDFRLLTASDNRPTRLIVADRDFGDSYAASQVVHFDYYVLTANEDKEVGEPPLYFKQEKTVTSKDVYCDVNEAFDKELELGESD